MICVPLKMEGEFSIMEFIEETIAINIFNPNIRKIKCVENELDYLGDGTVFCEDDLEKGKIYTFIKGEMKSYGAMIFLKEVSSQYGFQSCLFEELEPYNRQIAAEAYEKWLKKELEMAEEDIEKGRVYTIEEVQEHLDKNLHE